MLELKDTVANQIQVLDDGTTIASILHALGWVKKEKARCKAKDAKRNTGRPVGRPRKNNLAPGEGLKPDE